jgi:hypothetical protein
MRKNLACYQKTRSSVVQKADTAKATTSKVSTSSLSLEDLVHLEDVLVASKYGSDLAQLTRALAEDLDDNLPRQIWSVVKDVIDNMQGKQTTDFASAVMPQVMALHGGVTNAAGGYQNTQPANLNLQQP